MAKRVITRALSALLGICIPFALAACGAGSVGITPATSGPTQVATGTIIGFGSVIVNGIKFSRKAGLADDRVKLRFENNTSASEGSLRIGMIVKVTGTFDSSTDTGEYESIEFQPEVRGPLDNASVNSVDLINNRIKVMGHEIQIEANTSFDNIRDLNEINDELLAGRHPELEVSGNQDNSTGILHATRIARKAPDFGALADKTVQIKGAITTANVASGATSGSFTIGSITVNFSASALGANTVSADIAAGTIVEVNGTLNGSVIAATRVEKKNAVEAGVNDKVCVKGTATGGVVNNTFTLNGPNGTIIVNTAAALFQKGAATATSDIVTAGTTLLVEGSILANGSIAATRVYYEVEKSVKVEGNALTGAFNAGTLTLNGIPVAIGATTRLLDNNGQTLDLTKIAAGDHLQIDGVFDGINNKVTASQIQRTSPSNVSLIQGPVTSKTATTLTMLGITVDTATIAQAKGFVDNRTGKQSAFGNTLAASQAAFIAAVTTDGLTVVKVTGTMSGATMSAAEAELEQPQ